MSLIFNTGKIMPAVPNSSDDKILKALNTAEWINYAGRPDIALDSAFSVLHHMWGGAEGSSITFGINDKYVMVIEFKHLFDLDLSFNIIAQLHFPKHCDYVMLHTSPFGQKVTLRNKHKKQTTHIKVQRVSRKVAYQTIEAIQNCYLKDDKKPVVTNQEIVTGRA